MNPNGIIFPVDKDGKPERVCANCKCMVTIREGINAGKHQCVVADHKNKRAPHVHYTMPHFKCSNNKFESKYGTI